MSIRQMSNVEDTKSELILLARMFANARLLTRDGSFAQGEAKMLSLERLRVDVSATLA